MAGSSGGRPRGVPQSPVPAPHRAAQDTQAWVACASGSSASGLSLARAGLEETQLGGLLAQLVTHPRVCRVVDEVACLGALVDEPVTSFQHSAVVTEQGVALIAGLDERTQARNLIDHAAHPRVRDELREDCLLYTSPSPRDS